MRIATLAAPALMLSAALLFADDHSVDFDRHTDFSTLKTFALRDGKVSSPRPELNNTLVMKKIADAIRTQLMAKGLKETLNAPDIVIDYSVSGQDFSEQRGGPASLSEGTLVVDLLKRVSGALIWRGVYRDSEKNNARLAQKLPEDVKKFMSEYPPKQKSPVTPGPSTLAAVKLTPREAAIAALEVIQSTRLQTDFVGPDAHPGLSVSLAQLERAARSFSEDNGRIPAAGANKGMAFFEALNSTADYAMSIASRNVETADSKARAQALASKLRSLAAN